MKANRHPLSRCDGVTRRDLITVGGLTAFGLGMPDVFSMRRLSAALKQSETKAKSCILIWLIPGEPRASFSAPSLEGGAPTPARHPPGPRVPTRPDCVTVE